MRLLQLKPNGEFSLTKDLIRNVPRYAILSHTWGDEDEELTFTDLIEGSGNSKVGYRKIRFCANQAARDDLQHFWVDTCCINKSNSTELSEAINSMFRWYRNAAKCYVYLSDVSTNDYNQTSLSFQSWEAAFRKSRWFTRGWTLQELIAPPSVEFFCSEGKRLGDKKSLERQIHEITGLAVTALQGNALFEFSITERMSWAKKRETTREEDMVYSLLGIFDVHMPLIYGEGMEKADRRLREEINKYSGIDRSELLPTEIHTQGASRLPQSSPLSISAIIPFRRDRDFIERPLLGEILQRATEPGARIGLVGLGGVGKSQLAIEYAYRVRDAHPQTRVFWVHASSTVRFEESFRKIASHLRLSGWNEPKANVLGMVHDWLADETNGQWTMVVDNADDNDVLFDPWNGGTRQNTTTASTDSTLSQSLPLSPNGSIVITSRSHEVIRRLQVFDEDLLKVGPMEVEVAMSLLLKKLKKAEKGASPNDMFRLVTQVDCMPLAISQAAAYIDQSTPRITVSRYAEVLEKNDDESAALLRKDIQDPRRDRQASNSITMTFHVTFTHLRRTRQSAARLLALMSLFDREAIPDYLLRGRYTETQDDRNDFEDDNMTLRAYSLIGVDESGNLFDMHRLVQLSIRKWLEIHLELQGWQERYITILGAAFPTGDYANWTTCQALLPHVEAMEMYRVTSADHLEVWATVLYNGAWYALERGQYGRADKMTRASLEVFQTVLGPVNEAVLDCTSILASVLGAQGKYEQAEEMNRRALAGKERILGVDHSCTLSSMGNLASVLRYQGKYEQAEEMNRRVLAGMERVLGVDHPSTLDSVYCLAHLLSQTQDHQEALNLYQRAIAGYEKVLSAGHPTTVACRRNKALLMEKMNL